MNNLPTALRCVRQVAAAAGLVLASLAATAAAEEPYRVLIALHYSDDPVFTRLYRSSLERQVRDQMAHYFGTLAQVEVTTSHPLIERLDGSDVRSLEPSSTEFPALQVPDKAFVFSLENVDGMYQAHWRQLDGRAQQVGAAQTRTTPDRQWLAKAVCMAVQEDFAPVVTVQPDSSVIDTGQVKLQFSSPAHRELAARWLTKGTILQPYWVIRQRDGSLQRVPIPHTVLRVSPNDEPGRTATFHSNLPNPWKPTSRLSHCEAIKLNAQAGHLRIRLVNAADGSPLLGCQVRANVDGFNAMGDKDQFTLPDRRGMVVSLSPIDRLAFVAIIQGGSSRLRVPIPITAPMCEVTLKVSLDERAKEKADWARRLHYLVQDLSVLQTSIYNMVRRTNQMHEEKKYEEELRLVRSVLDNVKSSGRSAQESKDLLDREAKDLNLESNSLLAWANAKLAEILDSQKSLAKKADDLDKMIQTMNAQARAQVLINAGDASAELGDWLDALDKYELALNELPEQPKLAERLKKLKAVWEIKSPEHERARKFIYETWASAEVTQLQQLFPDAERALATLESVGDYLSAQRLLTANNAHVGSIVDVMDLLISSGGERDLEDAEKYKQLNDKILQLQERVGIFIVSSNDGAGAAAPPATPASSEPVQPGAAPSGTKPAEEEEEPPPAKP